MSDDLPPPPDSIEGIAPPRLCRQIIGHQAALSEFIAARNSGRMHHAWLISGPKGVGKASLAWVLAAQLLGDGPTLREGGHPGLCLVQRLWDDKTKRYRSEITVEAIRALRSFLHLSASDGGWRVVIIDPADEMNGAAANAVLKLLEEPPARVIFFLISHQPGALLPTIRSRCRRLTLMALGASEQRAVIERASREGGLELPTDSETQALLQLAEGSPGEALRLRAMGGIEIWAQIREVLASLPRLNRLAALNLAQGSSGREGEARFDLLQALIRLLLAQLARAGAMGSPDPLLARLSPDLTTARRWADLAAQTDTRFARASALNLDATQAIYDFWLTAEETLNPQNLR